MAKEPDFHQTQTFPTHAGQIQLPTVSRTSTYKNHHIIEIKTEQGKIKNNWGTPDSSSVNVKVMDTLKKHSWYGLPEPVILSSIMSKIHFPP